MPCWLFSRLFFDGRRAPCVRVGLGWFEEISGGGPGCAGGGVERGAERARKLVSSFSVRSRRERSVCWSCLPLSQQASECVASKVNVLDKQTGNHWIRAGRTGGYKMLVQVVLLAGRDEDRNKSNREEKRRIGTMGLWDGKVERRENTQISQADCGRAASS